MRKAVLSVLACLLWQSAALPLNQLPQSPRYPALLETTAAPVGYSQIKRIAGNIKLMDMAQKKNVPILVFKPKDYNDEDVKSRVQSCQANAEWMYYIYAGKGAPGLHPGEVNWGTVADTLETPGKALLVRLIIAGAVTDDHNFVLQTYADGLRSKTQIYQAYQEKYGVAAWLGDAGDNYVAGYASATNNQFLTIPAPDAAVITTGRNWWRDNSATSEVQAEFRKLSSTDWNAVKVAWENLFGASGFAQDWMPITVSHLYSVTIDESATNTRARAVKL